MNSASSKSGRICSNHDKTWSKMGLFLISNPNLKIEKKMLLTTQKFQNFSDNERFSCFVGIFINFT
jgi:hypothetical protein